MRNIGKKPRNEPCRSPSPDIANRSIIKNTIIQVQSIKSKMKQAEEKQLKFQLQSSISQAAPSDLNSTFQNKYKHLYDQYSRIKNQNKSLIEQNTFLNQENKRLSQYDQRNKTLNQLTGALLSKNQNDPFLKEKINSLQSSRNKLQNDLTLERDRNNQYLKEIENLRLQEQLMKQQLYRTSRSQSYALEPVSLKEQEIKLTIFSNTLLNNLESQFRSRLIQLNNRINKIEVQQKIIKQQQYRLIAENSRFNKTPSSIRSSRKQVPSTGKGQSQTKEIYNSQYRSDKQVYPFPSSSPAEGRGNNNQDSIENLQYQNKTFLEQIRIKNMQILRLKDQKERLLTTLQQAQKEKKAPLSTPKFRENFDDAIFKRMTALEANSRHLQQQCISFESKANHYEQQCNRLIKQMDKLKQQGEEYKNQKLQLLNFIQHQKKMMKCYETEIKDPKSCQLCRQKDVQIKQLKQKLKKIQQNYKQQISQIVKQSQHDRENYQNRLKNAEFEYNQILRKISKNNEDLINQIIDAKKMLQYIKNKFQVQDISKLLEQNVSIYHQLESTFYSEREEYDRVVSDCRLKILFQEQEMARLQRESNLKTKKIQLLEIQLSKVKQINKQLQNSQMQKIKSNINFAGKQQIESKTNTFIANNSKIIDKVKEGNDRLGILYQKITNNTNCQLPSTLY